MSTSLGAKKTLAAAIDALHERCGVYTRSAIVCEVLDRVGWCDAADLSAARLLEPAAGSGAFVVEAALRLIESYRRRGIEPRARHLRRGILAFELHAEAAATARFRVAQELVSAKVNPRTATACVNAWIQEGDFLLSDQHGESYTHVVGNPPYLRWSRVPAPLRSLYEKHIPPRLTQGDLYLPFLDKALNELKIGGMCGFICSDRWQFASYGVSFWNSWQGRLSILRNEPIDASEAFTRDVSAYANMFVARKRSYAKPRRSTPKRRGRGQTRTLAERGCVVRVGPALGVTSAFVVESRSADVEQDLLLPWVASSEIRSGEVQWRGRLVISVFDEAGRLVDLADYPRLKRHLTRYRSELEARYIVRSGGRPWYRPIERLNPRPMAATKVAPAGYREEPNRGTGLLRPRTIARHICDLPACRQGGGDPCIAARWWSCGRTVWHCANPQERIHALLQALPGRYPHIAVQRCAALGCSAGDLRAYRWDPRATFNLVRPKRPAPLAGRQSSRVRAIC